jgi:Rrf2 family cysteine metabolism transcriptional repressor
MFKISTKGDYGLLLLSALAEKMKEGREFVSLKEVAQAKKLSLPYLSQIVIPLKEARLVKSKEGREGGYALARPAREISIMEILEVLEGPVAPVRCCDKKKGKCGSEPYCQVKFTWQSAKSMLVYFLKTKTLEDTISRKQPHDAIVTPFLHALH